MVNLTHAQAEPPEKDTMMIPNRQSPLAKWIDWLLNLHADEIDLGVTRVSHVARLMGVTKPAPFVISVAGTNGKGSSVAMLVAILKQAGYQVGAYTSPHILKFNERIQIKGDSVSDQVIIDAFVEIEAARKTTKLTYFEFSTLAALSVFKQAKLDVVILEVGLGGRLDAVNLVDADAALLTAIDIDHIDWLGSDRSVIATEKAGIMRQGSPAICSDPAPPKSLMNYASEKQVELMQFKVDFDIQVNDQAWSFKVLSPNQVLNASSGFKNLPFPALKGAFQLQNAAGVVALLLAIKADLPVSEKALCDGLLKVKHPGRLTSLAIGNQSWLMDVAHNPQSAEALAGFLAKSLPTVVERTALFSVLSDKDAGPMIKTVSPFITSWVIADLMIPRSNCSEDLMQLLVDNGVNPTAITIEPTIASAVSGILMTQKKNILVWGSFFTVAQAYEALSVNSTHQVLLDG